MENSSFDYKIHHFHSPPITVVEHGIPRYVVLHPCAVALLQYPTDLAAQQSLGLGVWVRAGRDGLEQCGEPGCTAINTKVLSQNDPSKSSGGGD